MRPRARAHTVRAAVPRRHAGAAGHGIARCRVRFALHMAEIGPNDRTPHRLRLGPSDLDVYPVALGGNVFGWGADEEQSFAVLDGYLAAGGNFVDTADVYSAWVPGNQGGESEAVIGNWLASRGNRDDVVLATKVGGHPEYKGLAAATIKGGIEASLRRLRTDYIDLFYTHFDDPGVPVEEILGTLDGLVRDGKVRHIGASNLSAERLQESLAVSEREGLASYVAVQPHYNLVSRDTYEGPLADTAARHGLVAVPYYALASGFLTGKYRSGAQVESVRAAGAGKHLETARGRAVITALDAIATERGVELATVALAWLAAKPTVATPLASARTVAQLSALLAVADVRLTDAEVARLDRASA
ncbi:aryl-alcohol dehydrogenase-like predicted oxidoreductase [Murinocardiopsis flavida]|uniref:Aryl-alcohol dehydrogenase-like predicted oxidoreductase n=2 Tax=Murinocardiopsis flavida TaxID=645275 RepID=A0A2P8DGB5_9ACTN|nr:aryl-alcohol dehydrogenase-like predicted oxidoreductase [Murinocardiopsis flavida]